MYDSRGEGVERVSGSYIDEKLEFLRLNDNA